MERFIQSASLLAAIPLLAQVQSLSLREAAQTALEHHPSIAVSQSVVEASAARSREAAAGMLPKVNFAESFQRSDNPVFVFGALLTQHQFGTANFSIGPLNRPDFLNNFQSQFVVDQPLWDAGLTKHARTAAELGRALSQEESRQTRTQVVAQVVRTYSAAVLAEDMRTATAEALKSAEADLQQAEARRAAGTATDADVLAVRVHVASLKGVKARRDADVEVGQAALNDAMGMPLEALHTLTTPPGDAALAVTSLAEYERSAAAHRPEVAQRQHSQGLAAARLKSSKAMLLPQVAARGVFEADRQEFAAKGGANWSVGVALKWNLFDGNANRARIAAAATEVERARAESRRTASAVQLEVRRAWGDWTAAKAQVEAASAAVAEAEESLRIMRNRYAGGLATMTELLRGEVALVETKASRQAALHDLRVAAAGLELAAGTLDADSPSLR